MDKRKKIGRFFFRWRGVLPIPWILFYMFFARPNIVSIIVGLILFIYGEGIRLWANTHIGPASRAGRIGADMLVTKGPYSFVRHPIYMGNILMSAGEIFASFALFPFQLALIVYFPIFYYIFISWAEEDYLKERFSSYSEYKSDKPVLFSSKLITNFGEDGISSGAFSVEKWTIISHEIIWIIILVMFATGHNLSYLFEFLH
jgi:protein-S-isoprenylcysteine O-methyltransferase Ste14